MRILCPVIGAQALLALTREANGPQRCPIFPARRRRAVENGSGAKLHRPEFFRLLSDCGPGDLLLVEQVDRLSRLSTGDWDTLKAEIAARHVRVVALDLPTSWLMARGEADAFTERMFDASTGCCWTCSPPSRARTMRIAGDGRRKA